MNRVIFLILFFFNTLLAGGSSLIIDHNDKGALNLEPHLSVLKTSHKDASLQTRLQSEEFKSQFIPLQDKNLHYGFIDSVFWFRFSVKNQGLFPKNLILSLNYPLINHVTFYTVKQETVVRQIHTGELHPFSTRNYNNRNFIYSINLLPLEEKTIYLRLWNNGETVQGKLNLTTESYYFIQDAEKLSYNYLYYGFMVFAFMLNVFLYSTIKDRTYLYVLLYIACLSFFLFNVDGFSYKHLWSQAPWWANHSTNWFVTLAAIFLLLFTRSYFLVSRYMPVINRLIHYKIGLLLILSLLAFTTYPFCVYIVRIINYMAILVVFFILVVAVKAMRFYFREALFFLGSFVLLLVGVLFYVMKNMGMVSLSPLSYYGIKIGFGMQVLFLSYAVTYRFKRVMEFTQRELEHTVNKRTAEIQKQKEKLTEQRDLANAQKDKIYYQRKEILQSMEYAQRIQNAILPPYKAFNQFFRDSFVYFYPREPVSGDFYWINNINGQTFFVVADCTGHGVPGAFMSLLGVSFLNEIVNKMAVKKSHIQPHTVLNELRNYVFDTISSYSIEKEQVKDGIEMVFCIYDPDERALYFSGARRPLYLVRNSEIYIYKGDLKTVGYNVRSFQSFTSHKISVQKDDVVYLFSDGFVDQFGGENGKKFLISRFRQLLLNIHQKPMDEQKQWLKDTFQQWKGEEEQIDDVLVMGIRF